MRDLDLGWLWHLIGGAIFTSLMISLADYGMADAAIDLFLFGWVRESSQHDWDMNRHRWVEALAWPAGALVGLFL